MSQVYVSHCPLEPIPMLGLWRTTKPLEVYVGLIRIHIPQAFYSDLASVPNWAWPMLDCTPNDLSVAGLVHDYLSRKDARRYYITADIGVTFEQATHTFNLIMEWSLISPRDRWKVISAVKLDPDSYWHQKAVDWRPEELS